MAMKYQPYRGYGRHPWLYYPLRRNTAPQRIHTPGGYRYNHPEDSEWFPKYWQCPSGNGGSVYEKQRAHRVFRRWAKRAITDELAGDDVSHAFRYYGDWLD